MKDTENRAQGQQTVKAVERWAASIMEWNLPWKTGIYPGEMAMFLGICDQYGIKSVIDSGRGPHAYSTHVLGEFARLKGIHVVSIDFTDPQEKKYAESLKQYENLSCLTGDTLKLLPEALSRMEPPIALLVDGPKMKPANRMSLVASVLFDVPVVAHHNCPLDSSWGRHFNKCFQDAFNQMNLETSDLWMKFREWEYQWTKGYTVERHDRGTFIGRSLDDYSLAIGFSHGYYGVEKKIWQGGLKAYLMARSWKAQLAGVNS